jgi:hypothetical protein
LRASSFESHARAPKLFDPAPACVDAIAVRLCEHRNGPGRVREAPQIDVEEQPCIAASTQLVQLHEPAAKLRQSGAVL